MSDVEFNVGDLVSLPAEMPGYEGTVYTVAGIWPDHGWVQLRERANPIGLGLKRAPGTAASSSRFPPPLLDPGWNAVQRRLVEHSLDDGGYVQHWDDHDGRHFCPVCPGPIQQGSLF